jgi:hypothetical protein
MVIEFTSIQKKDETVDVTSAALPLSSTRRRWCLLSATSGLSQNYFNGEVEYNPYVKTLPLTKKYGQQIGGRAI